MKLEECFGILSSPRAPVKQKERARRKFIKRSPCDPSVFVSTIPDTGIDNRNVWGHASIILLPSPCHQQITFTGEAKELEIRFDADICVLMDEAGNELFSGAYARCKKLAISARRQIHEKARKLANQLSSTQTEPAPTGPVAELVSGMKRICGYHPVFCYDFHISVRVSSASARVITIVDVEIDDCRVVYQKNLALFSVADSEAGIEYIDKDIANDALEVIAKLCDVYYFPNLHQSPTAKSYGFYNLYTTYNLRAEYEKNIGDRKFRTKTPSPTGLYRVGKTTDKSVWCIPADGDERVKQLLSAAGFM